MIFILLLFAVLNASIYAQSQCQYIVTTDLYQSGNVHFYNGMSLINYPHSFTLSLSIQGQDSIFRYIIGLSSIENYNPDIGLNFVVTGKKQENNKFTFLLDMQQNQQWTSLSVVYFFIYESSIHSGEQTFYLLMTGKNEKSIQLISSNKKQITYFSKSYITGIRVDTQYPIITLQSEVQQNSINLIIEFQSEYQVIQFIQIHYIIFPMYENNYSHFQRIDLLGGLFKFNESDYQIEKINLCSQISSTYTSCISGYKFGKENICEPICGDGKDNNQQCDDGNQLNGDGCSDQCKIQQGFVCTNGSTLQKSACITFQPGNNRIIVRDNVLTKESIIQSININYLTPCMRSDQCKQCDEVIDIVLPQQYKDVSVQMKYIPDSDKQFITIFKFPNNLPYPIHYFVRFNPRMSQEYLKCFSFSQLDLIVLGHLDYLLSAGEIDEQMRIADSIETTKTGIDINETINEVNNSSNLMNNREKEQIVRK